MGSGASTAKSKKKKKPAARKPDAAAPVKKKTLKKDADDEAPVMDWRLQQWLPPRAKTLAEDAEALQELFRLEKLEDGRPSGEEWFIKIGWKTFPDDPARWYGVAVERSHGQPRVRGLALPGNLLRGAIPRSLGSLVKLKKLDLSNNALEGVIPAPIVLMTQNQLEEFSFKNNSGAGLTLPSDIGALTVLTTLKMPAQNLRGAIPEGIKFLKCLKQIDLSQNRFTGPVPGESFKWMKSLEQVDLTYNLLVRR
jgi:hypothetical protein